MKKYSTILLAIIGALCVTACSDQNIQSRGFSLPAGDIEAGRVLFLEYHCVGCHKLSGEEFSDPQWQRRDDGGVAIQLGGATTKLQTYGDLVTSIINPSHRIAKGYPVDELMENGESKMDYYNQVMTVADLIDLVTFLKSEYEFIPPADTVYPYYVYPN